MKEKLHFFGEYVQFLDGDKIAEDEARLYLTLWKKFLIQKLNKDCYRVEIVDEQWGGRDPMMISCLAQCRQICLRLGIKVSFKFEVSPLGEDGIQR